MQVIRVTRICAVFLFLRAMNQADILVWPFGDCRKGQIRSPANLMSRSLLRSI